MKKGTKVSWTLSNGIVGTGFTISEPDDTGHVPVAVLDAGEGESNSLFEREAHRLIYCAVTWLTAIPEPAAPVPPAPPTPPAA